MILDLKSNLKYSNLSGDRNKIHLSNEYANKFHLKKPINHGCNLLYLSIKHSFKSRNIFIKKLSAKFLKPVFIGENFQFSKEKNSINILKKKKKIIKTKILILKEKNNLNKLNTHLKKISNIVGNFQLKPSLILNLDLSIKDSSKNKNFIGAKISKIRKNLYTLSLKDKQFSSKCLFATLVEKEKFQFIKKDIYKNKKALIFGKNSDLGNFAALYLKSLGFKIDYFDNYIDKKNIKNFRVFRDYNKSNYTHIFYFISRKIEPFKIKNYDIENIFYFKKVVQFFLNKNIKFFYPSTYFINVPVAGYERYIMSKKKAELWIKKQKFKNQIFIARIPQLKSSQTYNIFGEYSGKSLVSMKKFINRFLKKIN